MARYRLRLLLQEFDLPPGETILGRSPECHVTIDDPLVSREHAKILVSSDRVVLHDLGSRNGSKVNGAPVRGDVVLADGDRIRIGNQEIVFSRVVAPRRPGRPTGSLRNCGRCGTPYMAEAPACPNCGYVPGSEDTLNGSAPIGNLDRETWSLQLQVELLDKALSLQRLSDGERVLSRIMVSVEERLVAGLAVEPQQLDAAFRAAIRLASAQGEHKWIKWVVATSSRLSRAPSGDFVTTLGQVPPILLDAVLPQLDDLVETFRGAETDDDGRSALSALASLRDQLRRGNARPSPDAGSS